MRNSFLSVALLVATVLSACCGKEKEQGFAAAPDRMAIGLADSIYDAAELEKWIGYYDAEGDRYSALVLRQKYGSVKRNASDFETAIETHAVCIDDARALGDTLQLIIAYNNQGTNYRRLGDLEEASNCHYAALDLCDLITGDTTFTARKNVVRTLNGLGNVMLSLGNGEVAEQMFRRALKGERELGSLTGEAINLANIGAIKEMDGELDSARIYYNLSLEKNVAHNNVIGISLCLRNLGNIHELEGKYDDAKKNYLQSYSMGKGTNDVWHWLNSCTSLANLYLETGELDSAAYYIGEAVVAAERINAKGRLPHIYTLQSMVLEKRNRYKEALGYTRLAHQYKDSIGYEENRNHLHSLRINYEIKKRNEEVARAQLDAEHEKRLRELIMWSAIILTVLAVVTLVALVLAGKSRKRANIALRRTDEERRLFYRNATHRLKTPLTVIVGMTEELKRHIPESDDVAQQEFDAITRKGNELVALVTQMTEYNAGQIESLELTELAQQDVVARKESCGMQCGSGEEGYILVAEDDKDVAFMITQMLKNQGYSFKWAANGREAYDLIWQSMPRLLITDVMMPEMDGLELTRLIRKDEERRHLPVIIVSARTGNEDRLAGIDAGAEVYLGKPFVPDELLLRVRKLLEQREMLKKAYGEEIRQADEQAQNELIEGLKSSEKEFIMKIDSYIQENITECQLNPGALASLMAMSITTLNRRISAITGHNTTNYIRLKRLARAKFLLRNTGMTMGEIQAVCGFESPSYFSRAFKGEFGLTPSEYRRDSATGKG